jgi:hypothetical protein
MQQVINGNIQGLSQKNQFKVSSNAIACLNPANGFVIDIKPQKLYFCCKLLLGKLGYFSCSGLPYQRIQNVIPVPLILR